MALTGSARELPLFHVVYSLMGHFMMSYTVILKSHKGKYTVTEFTSTVG